MSVAKASHSHKTWDVFSSALDHLHKALLISPFM